jgi:hypothetical protein
VLIGELRSGNRRSAKRNMAEKKQKAKKMSEVQARLEIENNITFLKSLKLELKQARREEKMQTLIHNRKGYRRFEV